VLAAVASLPTCGHLNRRRQVTLMEEGGLTICGSCLDRTYALRDAYDAGVLSKEQIAAELASWGWPRPDAIASFIRDLDEAPPEAQGVYSIRDLLREAV
jgi:uncharacterized protein YuzB (UPF0349 family)